MHYSYMFWKYSMFQINLVNNNICTLFQTHRPFNHNIRLQTFPVRSTQKELTSQPHTGLTCQEFYYLHIIYQCCRITYLVDWAWWGCQDQEGLQCQVGPVAQRKKIIKKGKAVEQGTYCGMESDDGCYNKCMTWWLNTCQYHIPGRSMYPNKPNKSEILV